MSVEEIRKCDRCGKPFEYSLSKWAGYFKYGIKKKIDCAFIQCFMVIQMAIHM